MASSHLTPLPTWFTRLWGRAPVSTLAANAVGSGSAPRVHMARDAVINRHHAAIHGASGTNKGCVMDWWNITGVASVSCQQGLCASILCLFHTYYSGILQNLEPVGNKRTFFVMVLDF